MKEKIENIRISIVMINFNGLQYIKRTIPKLLDTLRHDYELIIVDNGSTDGSIEYLESIHQIQLIRSPRIREKNFSCNYAVTLAKGKYIFLCDNDLLITNKNLLGELMNYYLTLDDCGSINIAFYDEGKNESRGYGLFFSSYFYSLPKIIDNQKIKAYDKKLIGFPYGIGIFIEKDVRKKVGGYDDFLKFGGDDNDLGIKLRIMGYKNYLYAKSLQIHIGKAERNDVSKFLVKFQETHFAHLYTITKNYNPKNLFPTILLYSIYSLVKAARHTILKKNIGFIIAYIKGRNMFFSSLKTNLEKRDKIQSTRKIKDDIFLKIRPEL